MADVIVQDALVIEGKQAWGGGIRPISRCGICGRRLSDPSSVARGIGPVCAAGHHRGLEQGKSEQMSDGSLFGMPIEQHGLIVQRTNGRVYTNVPHMVVHHSPSGFEFGYGGSGPADLALNALEHALHVLGHKGPTVPCYDGHCFEQAWAHHQQFKFEFIAPMDREEGGAIPWEVVKAWIEVRM